MPSSRISHETRGRISNPYQYINITMYVCTYVCTYACARMYSCMYACINVCMYRCIYVSEHRSYTDLGDEIESISSWFPFFLLLSHRREEKVKFDSVSITYVSNIVLMRSIVENKSRQK